MAGKASVYFTGFGDKNSVGYRADIISKNSWMDLYADLYRQTHGGSADALTILEDAERRLAILKANGIR